MKFRPVLFLFLLCTLFQFNTSAQSDSCGLRISLLTCSPGEDLYSTFGHSALRVIDSSRGTDIVFNYGTFEFNDEFYMKFVRGKLNYFLSIEQYNDFLAAYQWEKRGIVEQVLQLTCEEKQRLLAALLLNARDENKFYKYDFLFDNCTTRLRDMVTKYTSNRVIFKNILTEGVPSFRQMLYSYLNPAGQHWSKFGIDILLGSKLDKKVTNEEAMFLPDYLEKGFDNAITSGKALVASKQSILPAAPLEPATTWFRPELFFSIFFLLIAGLTFIRNKVVVTTLRIFDLVFFFILGLLGVLLLFMWFGTDHVLCSDNYNLLWALPTHLPVVFFWNSKKQWLKRYVTVTMIIALILAVGWKFLPQQLNLAILPILGIIIVRCWKKVSLLKTGSK